jgi:hypothetical protein
MNLVIMQFSLASYYFTIPTSKYSHQHPTLQHIQSMFIPNVRDQVSDSYKTTVLYILIFMFLDSRQEDRRL